jgi:hypothetical protein
MGGDPFRKFAARRYTPDDLARLTDEEEQILLGRCRASPQEMATKMHMSVESIHRRQRSIIDKLQ